MTAATTVPEPAEDEGGPLAVFRNGGFLRLWLSQAATQIGGNMVLFGLTVIVFNSTNSNTAVSLLILTFLVPAVLFSAVAGRLRRPGRPAAHPDRDEPPARRWRSSRSISPARNLALILLLNVVVSTVTVFFAPAELAMIPVLVPRRQLLAANGIFTLTLNAAFAVGLRAARSAGRQGRRARGGHPRRRRPVLPRRGLLRHAAGVAAAAVDRRGAAPRPRGRGRGARGRDRRSASCARGSRFIRGQPHRSAGR